MGTTDTSIVLIIIASVLIASNQPKFIKILAGGHVLQNKLAIS